MLSSEALKIGFYSGIYRRNDSDKVSKEMFTFELTGFEFVGENSSGEWIVIPSGDDYITLLR